VYKELKESLTTVTFLIIIKKLMREKIIVNKKNFLNLFSKNRKIIKEKQ
tara:strand:+ start:1423 stop:1569 length:147 start_codon:yes stop_codon:yes gene_type:complete